MNAEQKALRVTNEAIYGVSGDANADDAMFVCECGAKDCEAVIRLTRSEFEAFCACANGTPLITPAHR
jgi:hypothetical protein